MTHHLGTVTAHDLVDRMESPLDIDGYDWRRAQDGQLTADEIFQLTYAAQVEWGTQGTFASLDISDDPIVSRFLHIWLRQEEVHAELLVRFLHECEVHVTALHTSLKHRRGAKRGMRINQLAHQIIGDDFFAVHMAWGAVNELTTLRFYQQIRSRTQHLFLRDLLRDLIAQEALHYSFYRTAAIERLTDNPRAQRITRFVLGHLWSPVGVGLRSRTDAHYLLQSLFADTPDTITHMDRAIRTLPGLDRLHLLHHELGRAA
jgi:hypothetical protein